MKVNPWKDQLVMYYLSVGAIEVDDEGQIWKVRDKRGKGWTWRDVKPRRIGIKNKDGYLMIQFMFHREHYTILSHRVVWIVNNGLIPEGLKVNHKNGIKDDNRPENIELMTTSENIKHSFEMLGRKALRGERHGMTQLTEKNVIEIRKTHRNNKIATDKLGKMFNISGRTVRDIVNRKSWAHI